MADGLSSAYPLIYLGRSQVRIKHNKRGRMLPLQGE